MGSINFKREITGDLESTIQRVTEVLKGHGFGILTRIDFHQKVKEKLGKTVPPTVILGACNPELALQAFNLNTDVTGVMPCNAVVREIKPTLYSVEIARPTSMVEPLKDPKLSKLLEDADLTLQKAIEEI